MDAVRDGARGDIKIPPPNGEGVSLVGTRSHGISPESSRQHDLTPSRGIMWIRCQEPGCRKVYDSVAVPVGDNADGKFSDGVCPSCTPAVVRRFRVEMFLALTCEVCAVQLAIDGVCPSCLLSHDRQRCAGCGRFATHREDCPTMVPGPVLTHGGRPDPLEGIMALLVMAAPWALLAAQFGGGR